MPKLFVHLSGGLGNQMFQYAIGRSIALSTNVELIFDTVSGFERDFQYRRKYELKSFDLEINVATLLQRTNLVLRRARNKFLTRYKSFYQPGWLTDFYFENEFIFQPILSAPDLGRDTWLVGYWQSPKYFDSCMSLLQTELMPLQPVAQKFRELGALIDQSDSVALGIRLYEESRNPGDHASTGRLKTNEEINLAVNKLRTLKPHARFFVFCTHRAAELAKLNLPPDTIFVTPDEGYADSVSCLWLLTRCKHHIFTNSTFYWWGAWLSHAIHNPSEQLIFAADNFINIDGLCEHWNTF